MFVLLGSKGLQLCSHEAARYALNSMQLFCFSNGNLPIAIEVTCKGDSTVCFPPLFSLNEYVVYKKYIYTSIIYIYVYIYIYFFFFLYIRLSSNKKLLSFSLSTLANYIS